MTTRVCLLTLSRVADDPRVRRHGDSLAAAGYDVIAVGSGGARSDPPSWPVEELNNTCLRDPALRRALSLPWARRGSSQALRIYWASATNRHIWAQVCDIEAEIYIANDWPVLPVAARLAAVHSSRYIYDSHEYAIQEHADRRLWRLFYPPFIRGLEQQLAPAAANVMTVSDGIAERLQRDLSLTRRPAVVRNLPPYRAMPYRPTGGEIEVLYQGMLAPDRGIEALITSTREWRPGRRLVVRGIGDTAYVDSLRRLIPSPDLVRFEPPGRPDDLVMLASRSDVGVHPITGTSAQIRYSLPNKFFEYLVAGLALCVSDMPEMSRLVDEFDLGVKIAKPDAAGIAAAVNTFDRDRVNHYKTRALDAARHLSWEREQSRFLEAFASAASGQ